MIRVDNQDALIIATNFWESDAAKAGKFWVSINAGTIRVLIPAAHISSIADMQAARECIFSRGPWPEVHQENAFEILFDDGSDEPYALFLLENSFDMVPGEPEPGREWRLSCWINKDGKPEKVLERICHWRRVPEIPCLKPWRGN